MKSLFTLPIKAMRKTCLKFSLTGLCWLCALHIGIAQAPNQDSLTTSCAFLQQLHQGTLLIRLPDRSLSLGALKERGLEEKAAELRAELAEEQKETMLSFKHTFDFAPVYFFYASHSEAIRAGRYEVIFDAESQPVPADHIQGKVFIGEFGETPKLGISGLILMNDQMLPYGEPLPFYEKKYLWGGLIKRSKAEIAEAYQKKLTAQFSGCR